MGKRRKVRRARCARHLYLDPAKTRRGRVSERGLEVVVERWRWPSACGSTIENTSVSERGKEGIQRS